MRRGGLILGILLAVLAAPLAAKPALRDVPEIDEGLFVVGLAHEIHKKCPSIEARILKGLGTLQDLQRQARDLGYSEEEVRRHVSSKAEKKRLRARAADYMAARGFGQTEEGYCALGTDEIARKSEIGALLRASE
jgi:predicted transcriptional regulator